MEAEPDAPPNRRSGLSLPRLHTLTAVLREAPKAGVGFTILMVILLVGVLHGPILALIGLATKKKGMLESARAQ